MFQDTVKVVQLFMQRDPDSLNFLCVCVFQDTVKVVQQFMQRDPDSLNFTVVALAKA